MVYYGPHYTPAHTIYHYQLYFHEIHCMERTGKKGIGFTLPVNPMLRGILSVACSIRRMCSGDGVQVVAQVPEAGPVPPPTKVVTPVPPRGSKFID